MKKGIITALLLAGLLGGLRTPAQAQSLDLSSSMTAQCVGGSCAMVSFMLDVTGSVYVDVVRLFSLDQALWRFGSLVSVLNSSFVDVTSQFFSAVHDGGSGTGTGIALTALSAVPASEPLYMTVAMSQYGTADQLWANLAYSANGVTTLPAGTNGFYSTAGTVTPEPGTTVLLATGLLGIAVVAWRRRRDGFRA